MKIETDNNSVILAAIIGAVIILSITIAGAYWHYTTIGTAAVKAGLYEVPDAASGTHWGKQ